MSSLGTERDPMRVAIIGAGPSGFYAAEALIKSGISVRMDMYERLPSPYGLVRSGVAPDHPKLKQAILLYDRIAEREQYNLIGNVTVGRDVGVEELRDAYHALIFTCGAETDRALGIAGESLAGSHTATEFVGWYNGHPDYRDREFDLSCEAAVIIGQGNVAADVSRILSKTVEELRHTDIAQHALEVLAESKVREIYVLGRRGPAQAKFTSKELKEFGELADCDPVVKAEELALNPASEAELADKTNAGNKKVYELFREYAGRDGGNKSRRCHFQFLRGPVAFAGAGRLEKVTVRYNQLVGEAFSQSARGTEVTYDMDAGVVFRSIGYRGIAIQGVPFDEGRGIFPNTDGRITENGRAVPQLYAAGWIKRGPTGIIGTNRACSVATVNSLLADLETLDGEAKKSGAEAIMPLLNARGVKCLSFDQWKHIDSREIENGQRVGKPREKYTSVDEMLAVAGHTPA